MYRLIDTDNGAIIGLVSEPLYIRISPSNGSLVATEPRLAQGVAYKSTPYNLMGKDGVNAEKTVLVEELDITDLVFNIPDLENAICEMDIAYEARISAIEDALCELDKEEMQ